MGEVIAKNKDVAATIRDELPAAIEKLNGEELRDFADAFISGLEKAKASTEDLEVAMMTISTQAAKSLGVDLVGSLQGVSEEFKQNEISLARLIESSDRLAAVGVNMGHLLQDSLEGVLEKARNPVEITALIEKWKELGREGKIAGTDMVAGIEMAEAKIDDLLPGINSVREAFHTFGLETRAEIQRTADDMAQAFDRIQADGTAAPFQIRDAIQQMAQAHADANDGMVSSTIRAKAAMEGLEIQVDRMGRVSVTAIDGATESMRRFKRAAEETRNAVAVMGVEDSPSLSVLGKDSPSTASYQVGATQVLMDRMKEASKSGDYSGFSQSDLALAKTWLEASKANKQTAEHYSHFFSRQAVTDINEQLRTAQRAVDILGTRFGGGSGNGLSNGSTGTGGFSSGSGYGGFADLSDRTIEQMASAFASAHADQRDGSQHTN